MSSGLTATMDFGLNVAAMRAALAGIASGHIRSFRRDVGVAGDLGIGTVQVEALGAWLRLAGLVERHDAGIRLCGLGRVARDFDPDLATETTWAAVHWQLSNSYIVWGILRGLEMRQYRTDEIDTVLQRAAPDVSPRTVANARNALLRTLEGTPLGHELGLVRLESDGRRITGLTKLRVRHGGAPMAAVGYALLDWARREELSSAPLESLTAPDGPGPILHMSEGVLERYVMDIEGAFAGAVLSYSRTAGLNEVYFKRANTPLQVLASHYIRERDNLAWPDALAAAVQEVGDDDAD